MTKALILITSLLLCGNAFGRVADIRSMVKVGNGFDVNCMNGSNEMASVNDVLNDRVCGLDQDQFKKARQTCISQFVGDENEDRCIRAARKFSMNTEQINSCVSQFVGADNELTCLMHCGNNGLVEEDIKFCVQSKVGVEAELQCLEDLI